MVDRQNYNSNREHLKTRDKNYRGHSHSSWSKETQNNKNVFIPPKCSGVRQLHFKVLLLL